MKTIRLPGVSRPVSQVCLGTAYMGSREDDRTSFAILDEYYARGGRFLNTAHEYGDGESERVIGLWARERGVREEILVTTKCGEDRRVPGMCAMRAGDIFEDVDETLSRSGFEYVDFCLLHVDDPTVPVGEIVDALYELRCRGKIRYYGCSNWTVARQREAAEWCARHGYPPFVMDEIEMNLARLNRSNHRDVSKWLDEEYIAHHEQTGMPVAAYSPVCNALLTKYLRDGDTRAWKSHQLRFYENDYNFEIARRLGRLSAETGRTPTQLQLAWVLSQPFGFPCFPILGARSVEQLKETLDGIDFEMTREMAEFLRPRGGL